MRIQRKLLTEEQKKVICDDNYSHKGCGYCPLRIDFDMGDGWNSCGWAKEKEKQIVNYWNEEIEINEEN